MAGQATCAADQISSQTHMTAAKARANTAPFTKPWRKLRQKDWVFMAGQAAGAFAGSACFSLGK